MNTVFILMYLNKGGGKYYHNYLKINYLSLIITH